MGLRSGAMPTILSAVLASLLLVEPSAAATSACAAPEHRQFDFWIGDWNVYDAGDPKPSMRIKVEKILDGCALRETYQDVNGMRGESLNFYDAGRKLWHQAWTTNRGQVLLLEGKLENGKMAFRATERTPQGPLLWRAVWIPQGDEVRETAETSADGGKTWKPKFDIVFRKRR
jgi:hypothetical protein